MALSNRIPLLFAKPGSRVKVISFEGGRGSMRRLFELGVVPGEELRVVFNNAGPIVVERSGTRIAIGRGLAARIIVEVIE
ncbi:MAG: FeoA family protein [Infirmifilum sp.]|jgi:ferrous iron transport protein A|uniref:Ferrous iron transporter FeoA-like domain-containing protein n=1 Tax=Infirmifilum uzonense TaxID=1550241 RepID=A0A0F7FIH1_9CREN|nr:FeoA family protein [Infirmifilum uzonense]AKG38740.1 hypothetical protein MA03_04890 [Infirmifilum uzonense]